MSTRYPFSMTPEEQNQIYKSARIKIAKMVFLKLAVTYVIWKMSRKVNEENVGAVTT